MKRIRVIFNLYLESFFSLESKLFIFFCFLALFFLTFFISVKSETVFIFSHEISKITPKYTKDSIISDFLAEFFYLAWIILVFKYITPVVIVPCHNSYTINQDLWLHFSYLTRIEKMIANYLLIIFHGTLMVFLCCIWVIFVKEYHDINPKELIIVLSGLPTYIMFTGSLCMLLGVLNNGRSYMVAILIIPLIPILTFMIYGVSKNPDENSLFDFIPFASPYSAFLLKIFNINIEEMILNHISSIICSLAIFLFCLFSTNLKNKFSFSLFYKNK